MSDWTSVAGITTRKTAAELFNQANPGINKSHFVRALLAVWGSVTPEIREMAVLSTKEEGNDGEEAQ